MSSYREYPPGPVLSPWVECFWTKRVGPESDAPRPTRVVPDGSADVIVDARSSTGSWIGTMTRPRLIPHTGALELAAIRFRPGGAAPFLGMPMERITDERIPLPDGEGIDLSSLGARVAEARSAEGRVDVLRATLLSALSTAEGPHALVAAAADRIAATGGRARVEDIVARLGVGRRRLERLFRRHVGISPKRLARIERLRVVLRRLERARPGPGADDRLEPARARTSEAAREGIDWIALALDAGYSDQPHLVREFRALTGTTPTRWRLE